jgi:copper chaperone CopZ
MNQQTANASITVHVTTLQIAGMSCDACVRHVTTSLGALEGIIHTQVDLKNNQAIVEHLPAYVDAAALVATIHSAGYTARVAGSSEDSDFRRSESSVSSSCGCGGCGSSRVQRWFDLGVSTIG